MTQADSLVIPQSVGGEMVWPESKPEPTPASAPAPEAAAPPAVQPSPEETPAKEEPPAPPPQPEPAQDTEDEAFLQVLDANPELAIQYYTAKYGPPEPIPTMPQPVQLPEPPQLPFEPEEFDPTDANHLMSLFDKVVYERNAPLYQYVQQLQQQDAQSQEALAQQRVASLEQNVQSMMNAFVPGIGEWASAVTNGGGKLTEQQELVASHALSLFAREMKRYPEQMRGATKLHQAVISKIGPKVKAFADAVGLNREGDPVARAEMHVQPSNAIPAKSQNFKSMYDAAWQAGDETKAVNALFEALHAQNRSK